MINKHKLNKIKENSNTVRHLNNGTHHRHSKSCCDQSSPARRTIREQQWSIPNFDRNEIEMMVEFICTAWSRFSMTYSLEQMIWFFSLCQYLCVYYFVWDQCVRTSHGSCCMGIKGEMSGTVCVTFTWDMHIYIYIYIYELFIAFVFFCVCSLL